MYFTEFDATIVISTSMIIDVYLWPQKAQQ